MLLDRFTSTNFQTHLDTTFDRFPCSPVLIKNIKYYLLSCRQEGHTNSTLARATIILRDFAKFCPVDYPNSGDIRLFLLSLQDRNLATGSVHTYYRVIKTFMNFLVREEIITKSPMTVIKAPRLTKVIIKPFTRNDIDRMLLLCSGKKFLDYRNRALVLVFLDTGVRLNEMANMQKADVNLDAETIRVMGKGQKERIVRIGKTTQRAMARYMYERDDKLPALWLTEEKRPITRAGVDIFVRRLTQRAGITDAHHGAHTFRHTCAINYLRNGGDQFSLQILLGHSSLEMTRRYVNSLSTDDMLRVHQKASPVDNMKL